MEYDVYKGVTAYQDFETTLSLLEQECESYDSIVLDSITTMQEKKMEMILQMTRKKVATQYEWMLLITQMKDLFTRITKMDKHVIVIAHEMLVQDDLTGEILYTPVIYGKKLPSQLPLFFDEVYRAQVGRDDKGKPVYGIQTAAGSNYMAKSRLGYLPTVLDLSKEGERVEAYEEIVAKEVKK